MLERVEVWLWFVRCQGVRQHVRERVMWLEVVEGEKGEDRVGYCLLIPHVELGSLWLDRMLRQVLRPVEKLSMKTGHRKKIRTRASIIRLK